MRRWRTATRRLAASFAAVWAFVAVSHSPARDDLAALAATQHPSTSGRGNRNPIFLISVDTLRADHLSCYGGVQEICMLRSRWRGLETES